MNTIYDPDGEEVSLYQLCMYLYQGYGATAVKDFIVREEPNQPWQECRACESECPVTPDVGPWVTCLVCGTLLPVDPGADLSLPRSAEGASYSF